MRLLLFGCCAASLAAQQVVRTAHPQDTLQNSNGNLAPLGVFANGQAAEARAQILLRPLELPGPGATLVGIEVHTQANTTLVYSSLTVRVSPTPAALLGNGFDGNLPAPTTVLQATNLMVPYGSAAWSPIAFQAPYVHDGQSALVIQFQKVVSQNTIVQTFMDTPSPPPRTDRPAMVYAIGGIGSGAANAAVATATGDPLCLRLLWTGVPTMRHVSDPGVSGNQYAIGSTVTYVVEGAPGSFYISGVDTALLPVPTPIAGASGLLYMFAPYHSFGNLDANGSVTRTVTIPPVASFVGLHVVYQAGVMHAVTGAGQLTNAHDHFVNP